MIRVIFIILLVYILFKIIGRYVMPLLARYFIRKAHDHYKSQNDYANRTDKNYDFGPPKRREKNISDSGEYIDYEEIKDK